MVTRADHVGTHGVPPTVEPTSPLLCDPADKAKLEAANGLAQVEYIAHLVSDGVKHVRESHLLNLHQLAVKDIYPCAGNYRRIDVQISNSPHKPPGWQLVEHYSRDALQWLNDETGTHSALQRAAFALWRFNWIHPFAGGNGRTSRALAYLIVCLEDGAMMPGRPTMPTLIYQRRAEYVAALQAADAADARGEHDLAAMAELLQDVLMRQLAAAVDRLSSPPG